MITETKYKTFSGFCKANNLIKGTIKKHLDGFVYCECKNRETRNNIVIYFDNNDNCVYYY